MLHLPFPVTLNFFPTLDKDSKTTILSPGNFDFKSIAAHIPEAPPPIITV
jgi:hypothetical protein